MRDHRKKFVLQRIQLRQLLRLRLQQCRLSRDVRLLPQDLQIAASQLPVPVPALFLVSGILVLDQQQPVENKEHREQMIEQVEIIVRVLEAVIIMLPNRIDQQEAGHRQGEGENDLIDIPQEED